MTNGTAAPKVSTGCPDAPAQSRSNDRRFGALLALPAIISVFVIIVYPLFDTVLVSFQKIDIFKHTTRFVGVANYVKLFNDPLFANALKVTLEYGAIVLMLATDSGPDVRAAAQRELSGPWFLSRHPDPALGIALGDHRLALGLGGRRPVRPAERLVVPVGHHHEVCCLSRQRRLGAVLLRRSPPSGGRPRSAASCSWPHCRPSRWTSTMRRRSTAPVCLGAFASSPCPGCSRPF